MPEDPEEEHKTIFFRAFFQYRHRLEKFRPINEPVSIRIHDVKYFPHKDWILRFLIHLSILAPNNVIDHGVPHREVDRQGRN